MNLIQTLKIELFTHRRANNVVARNLLTTLIGEAEMVGKNAGNRETSDAEVIAIVKKFIDKNREFAQLAGDSDVLKEELDILQKIMPPQLSYNELVAIFQELNAMNLGEAMKWLKQNYPGRYDGKEAKKAFEAQ